MSGKRPFGPIFVWLALLGTFAAALVGCARQAAPPATALATVAPAERLVPTPSSTPRPLTPTATTGATSPVAATAIPTYVFASPTLPPPDPYAAFSIDALAARPYGGGLLEIVDTLETNEDFTRYLITYPSDDLTIYGFMNVPNEGDSFPVALMLHGYIPPAEYETLAYTRRYADALARAGYFVIHPNYRGYPPSDDGPDPFRIGTAIDILNLIAIIREQSQDPLGTLRRADAEQIHLWGHSMGGGVALRVITVNNAPYIRAAALYGSMSGDEAQNYGRILEWSGGRTGEFELSASPEALDAISPGAHLHRVEAAVTVHHGNDDATVPVAWSEQLCAQLDALFTAGDIPGAPDCHFYAAQPHTFRGDGDALLMERVIAFFDAN